jgi:hypothetical protein
MRNSEVKKVPVKFILRFHILHAVKSSVIHIDNAQKISKSTFLSKTPRFFDGFHSSSVCLCGKSNMSMKMSMEQW